MALPIRPLYEYTLCTLLICVHCLIKVYTKTWRLMFNMFDWCRKSSRGHIHDGYTNNKV